MSLRFSLDLNPFYIVCFKGGSCIHNGFSFNKVGSSGTWLFFCKLWNGQKWPRRATILTILGPFESSWRDLSFETHCVFFSISFRTLFFVRGRGPWASFQSFRFVIQIKRKLKRKRKRKRKRGNLRGGREALPRRSLHPFRFWFRFRFNFRLIWITKRNGQYRRKIANYVETPLTVAGNCVLLLAILPIKLWQDPLVFSVFFGSPAKVGCSRLLLSLDVA